MSEQQYEYYVRLFRPDYTVERPGGLWRRSGGTWEYWSALDWAWHGLSADTVPRPPPAEGMVRITPDRAAELVAGRQSWVRYWAFYVDEPGTDVEPTTVVRRRSSPEHILDEVFNIHNEWTRTDTILEFESCRFSFPYHLVEIDRETAESILSRTPGVGGATVL